MAGLRVSRAAGAKGLRRSGLSAFWAGPGSRSAHARVIRRPIQAAN